MNEAAIVIFQLLVLLFSVIIHEVSHGVIALRLGDPTAKNLGRLTLNPIPHLDPVGSVLVPLVLTLFGGPVIGWAKPVPYNPRNLRDPKRGSGLIAVAGPVSNLLVAGIFGLLVRALAGFPGAASLLLFFQIIVFINILLAIFNLFPIPPLDGSGVLFSLLPARFRGIELLLARYGLIILLLFIYFGFPLLEPIVSALYNFFVGDAGLPIH